MYGAIIGDFVGSTYEFEQTKAIKSIKPECLILDNSFFSDDTILTIAIIDAILSGESYESKLKEYGLKYMDYHPNFNPYFKSAFSPGFVKWLKGNYQGSSTGNGAMMRISPIGYFFDSEEEVKREVLLATNPSHNSKEAIDCSNIIALIIFYKRKGLSKEEIIKKLELKYNKEDFIRFNMTCRETINNCLYVIFNSDSFEDSMFKMLSFGGDTDTNCAIVGSMAEAFYGIDERYIQKVNEKLPKDFVKVLSLAYKRIEWDGLNGKN